MTVRRPERSAGRFEAGAAVAALAIAVVAALGAAQLAGHHGPKSILAATIVMTAFAAVAAVGDASVVLRHGLAGAQRIARHLWRMCVAFAMAAGAFVTQPSMFPHPMPILLAAATLPLLLMIFWLCVVALTGRFRRAPIGEAAPPQAA
jgi:peptidoglycan/LPS O-acetylase OafA/YrhL